MNDYEERLIKFIRRARVEKDLTQAMLSKVSGVSRQAISNFERGVNGLNSSNLIKIFVALGKEDILKQLFPQNYTTPALEIKKENLEKASIRMRVRKSKTSLVDEVKTLKPKEERRTPFDEVLAKKSED